MEPLVRTETVSWGSLGPDWASGLQVVLLVIIRLWGCEVGKASGASRDGAMAMQAEARL